VWPRRLLSIRGSRNQEVLPYYSGRTLIHDHFVTSALPGTLLDILSLAKNLSDSGPFMTRGRWVICHGYESTAHPKYSLPGSLKVLKGVLAQRHVAPERERFLHVSPVSWCSELLLKKLEEVLAVCHVPLWRDIVHTSLIRECDGEIIHVPYLGEAQNERLWIGNLRLPVRRHHPGQIIFTYLDICLKNETASLRE